MKEIIREDSLGCYLDSGMQSLIINLRRRYQGGEGRRRRSDII